ncbi:MAG: hypothetical protein M0O96_02085 [Desulforhopalus sp.]|nr:hypothetical protein [Desulforhopalus sp.]
MFWGLGITNRKRWHVPFPLGMLPLEKQPEGGHLPGLGDERPLYRVVD